VIATWLAGILSQALAVPDRWPRAGYSDRAVCGPGHSSVWAPRAVPVDFPPLGLPAVFTITQAMVVYGLVYATVW